MKHKKEEEVPLNYINWDEEPEAIDNYPLLTMSLVVLVAILYFHLGVLFG